MKHSRQPSKSRSNRFITGTLYLLIAVVAFLFAVEQVYNYDIWWHLKTGEWILQRGEIPHADPFTFTIADAPWQPHYWLTDVGFALVWRISGINGLILCKALLIATAFLLVFHLMLKLGINPFLAAALVLLTVPAARFRFLLRPHIVMFPLTVTFFLILSEWDQKQPLKLLWLLPLMGLWVNLHASFFLGLALMGCLLAEGLCLSAYKRSYEKDSSVPWPGFLILLFALLIVFTLLNPFGIDLLHWVLRDFTLKNVTRTIEIEEHAALVWGEHRLFWGIMLTSAMSFLFAFRRSRIFHLLVFGVTVFLALRGVRFVAVAVLLQIPILGYNVQTALNSFPTKIYKPSRWIQAVVAIPLLILGSVLLFRWSFGESKVYRFGLGVNKNRFPVMAVHLLQQLNPEGEIYNSWEFGGYLLWELPDRKIFWDGRFLDAQSELFERLGTMSSEELDSFFDVFDIRIALISEKDSHFIPYFSRSDDFRLTYFDDHTLLFLKENALSPESWQQIRFFKFLHPEIHDFSYLIEYAQSPMAPEVEEELRRATALAPHSFKARFLLGVFLEAGGRGAEALKHYIAAIQVNPPLAFIHYGLGRRVGRLAVGLRQWEQALPLLRQALKFKEEDSEIMFLLGTSLYQLGSIDEAEEWYLKVLKQEPQQIASLINLGYLYIDLGHYQGAEQMHRRALETDSNNEQALFGLALVLQKEGKTEEALQRWQEFLEKHPQSPWTGKAREYLAQLISSAHK